MEKQLRKAGITIKSKDIAAALKRDSQNKLSGEADEDDSENVRTSQEMINYSNLNNSLLEDIVKISEAVAKALDLDESDAGIDEIIS